MVWQNEHCEKMHELRKRYVKWDVIAQHFPGKSEDACRFAYHRWLKRTGVKAAAASKPFDIHEVVEVSVRPFAVELPSPPAGSDGQLTTALIYGDTHFPFRRSASSQHCGAGNKKNINPTTSFMSVTCSTVTPYRGSRKTRRECRAYRRRSTPVASIWPGWLCWCRGLGATC